MDLSLEQRILRFLNREEEDEERSFRDLRWLTAEQRVLEGECIRDAELERQSPDRFVFRVGENLSKFRTGDALAVGDGLDFDKAAPLNYEDYDPTTGELVLSRDRWSRTEFELHEGTRYCIDRRSLGLRGRLQDVVRAGFADDHLRGVLEGSHQLGRDDARHERAVEKLAETRLNETQRRAGAAAIATESLALVQGPPGTGKTRLLAEVVSLLCHAGCRIALTAYTHRAVDNALRAIHAANPKTPLYKVGNAGSGASALRKIGVRLNQRANNLPQAGVVVSGTCFAIARMAAAERFHLTVFDEAGQIPIAHAIAGMLLARRWILFGDHRQLSPVITADHADREVTESIFARLHSLYGSELLDTSYRMNSGVCDVVSDAFYGGRLHPAESAADRAMPFVAGRGKFDEVLAPDVPVVLARIDHAQPGMRSAEEAALVADLCEELVQQHGILPKDIAVIAPFRAQIRQIRVAMQKRTGLDPENFVIDTVERIQGQEREVVIVSLAVGDPDTLDRRAAFFFSTNRLNVALSRARTKAILVASSGAFSALPRDAESLRAAGVFKKLFARLPQVDMTSRYCATPGQMPNSASPT